MSRAKKKASPKMTQYSPKQARKNLPPYLRNATEAFIKGTGCQTPDEAITKGHRTMEQWLETIEKHRKGGQCRKSTAA